MDWFSDLGDVPHIGKIFALCAPVAWSIAVILFRKSGEVVPALTLNLFKNVLAFLMLGATMLLLGQTAPEGVTGRDYALLLASGAIGMGLSDTAFFLCLNRIGAGLQAIVNTSYSPAVILLSIAFLGERLGLTQAVGVGLILAAVLTVAGAGATKGKKPPKALMVGILFGLFCTTSQAVSIVMIKSELAEWPLVWATMWRLVGGLAITPFLLPFLPERRKALASLLQVRVWPVMIPGAIMGTYVSLLFWMGGFKFAPASIASALNQTATLFIFILAVIFLREPVTPRRILALFIGVAGVGLVTLSG